MKLSILIPVYNGADSIQKLVEKIESELSEVNYEIVMVNDGSKDSSEQTCSTLADSSEKLKFISLRKNFGEHNTVMCGLNFIKGEYVVIIDDDFQNPPSEIKKLLNEIERGYDVVYSRFEKKNHKVWRNIGSKLTNMVATKLLKKPKDLYLSSFKILRKELVQSIIQYKGPSPYIDGLIWRSTNNYSVVEVIHNKRQSGTSNYTLKKLVSLYLNMFINFSVQPLRIFTLAGMIFFFISIAFSIVIIFERILMSNIPSGWTTLSLLTLFFGSLQLLFIGLIGEYLGKLFMDVNKSPQYVIKFKKL